MSHNHTDETVPRKTVPRNIYTRPTSHIYSMQSQLMSVYEETDMHMYDGMLCVSTVWKSWPHIPLEAKRVPTVCMYVCMYVCIHVCIYLCMYECMYLCIHVCMYEYIYIYIYIYVYIYIYIYMYV